MPDFKDILAVQDGKTWYFIGNAYPIKEMLKSHNCFWDEAHHCWAWRQPPNVTELPPVIAQFVTEVISENIAVAPDPVEVRVEVPINKATLTRETRKHHFKGVRWLPLVKPPVVEVTETFIQPSYWSDLLLYLTPGKSRPCVALIGPSGNGKTTAGEKALEAQHFDYVVIDCTEFIEPADLVGYMAFDPAKGRVWQDGKVAKAFREGNAVLFNEFDTLNPRAAMCLQSALQAPGPDKKGRYLAVVGNPDEDRVYPAAECPIILTMNTYGSGASRQYVGRNALDAATLDRVTIIETVYENDAAIVGAHGWQKSTAKRLETWAKDVRQLIDRHALKVVLSFRTLLRIAEGVELYGWEFELATEKEFLKRVEPETRKLLTPPPAPPRTRPPTPAPAPEAPKPQKRAPRAPKQKVNPRLPTPPDVPF